MSTSVEVDDTTKVSTSSATVTTIRMTQPQTASPVAVPAGLIFSTVSVKAAIHAQYAIPPPKAMTMNSTARW